MQQRQANFFEDNREITIILFKFGENVSFMGLFKVVNKLLLLAGPQLTIKTYWGFSFQYYEQER